MLIYGCDDAIELSSAEPEQEPPPPTEHPNFPIRCVCFE
jgi:hypothetical protein